jgi:hypothetical protein
MASSRPLTAGAAPKRTRSSVLRGLAVLPIVLLMAMALLSPATSIAAESNTSSGYNQEPNKPSTGTSPSKETTTPSKETTPSNETTPSTTSSTTTTTPTSKALPFTGFDLRWSFGIGLLLIGAGFSIVMIQRRQRRESGS